VESRNGLVNKQQRGVLAKIKLTDRERGVRGMTGGAEGVEPLLFELAPPSSLKHPKPRNSPNNLLFKTSNPFWEFISRC
jgi:hypothetical protein